MINQHFDGLQHLMSFSQLSVSGRLIQIHKKLSTSWSHTEVSPPACEQFKHYKVNKQTNVLRCYDLSWKWLVMVFNPCTVAHSWQHLEIKNMQENSRNYIHQSKIQYRNSTHIHTHTQTTNRSTATNNRENRKITKQKKTHKKRYSPHLLYNKAKITHILFKLHEKHTKKKRQKFKINRVRMWDKEEEKHWLIISKLYFYTKKSQSKKKRKRKTNQKQHIKIRKMK